MATAAFRRVFEKFHAETTARQWADAFATQRDPFAYFHTILDNPELAASMSVRAADRARRALAATAWS